MYTQDTFRGPSAGASGQDNVYMFDGVNITMPLFGVLNVNTSDPNNHDIAQVTVIRGGAKAVDFDRAGGFLIDTVSKSGTNKFSGEAGYEVLNKNFIADQTGAQVLTYQQNRAWANANIGGPILSGPPLLLRFVLPARLQADQPGERLRRAAAVRAQAHATSSAN